MKRAARATVLGLTALLAGVVPGIVWAHDLPEVTGMVAADDGSVVLSSTRGLIFGRLEGGAFRLQCLEASGLLASELPAVVWSANRAWVAGVHGLQSFDAAGCGQTPVAPLAATPVTDLHMRGDGFHVVTVAAGQVNDGWSSGDGSAWLPRGLALQQTLYSALRPFGDGEIATGVSLDAATGRVVHFVRELRDGSLVAEREIPLDADGYRVQWLDGRTTAAGPEALVLADEYRESAQPDRLLRYRDGGVEEVLRGRQLVDARFVGDDVWAATADGLVRWHNGEAAVVGPRRRITMVAVSGGAVYTATEYTVDGCALCRVEGDRLVSVLRFGEIAGPVECPESPGACAGDWSDWRNEVFAEGSGLDGSGSEDAGPDDGAGSGDGSPEKGTSGGGDAGCAASPGSGAVSCLVAAGFAVMGRRLSRRGRAARAPGG